MRYGICLPNFTDLASAEAIEAAAEAAEHLGWEAVWTTASLRFSGPARNGPKMQNEAVRRPPRP